MQVRVNVLRELGSCTQATHITSGYVNAFGVYQGAREIDEQQSPLKRTLTTVFRLLHSTVHDQRIHLNGQVCALPVSEVITSIT